MFKKDVKKELNTIWSEIYSIKKIISENNKEIRKDIKETDEHSKSKWTEHQKRLNEHMKKIEMLFNAENETRAALKKVIEIIQNKKEKKNEWTKSKHGNGKQNLPKHSKQRFIQK